MNNIATPFIIRYQLIISNNTDRPLLRIEHSFAKISDSSDDDSTESKIPIRYYK